MELKGNTEEEEGQEEGRGRRRKSIKTTTKKNLNMTNNHLHINNNEIELLSLLPCGTRWNRVEPADLTFQVRLVATNEQPTSNGSGEVDSHQSA